MEQPDHLRVALHRHPGHRLLSGEFDKLDPHFARQCAASPVNQSFDELRVEIRGKKGHRLLSGDAARQTDRAGWLGRRG